MIVCLFRKLAIYKHLSTRVRIQILWGTNSIKPKYIASDFIEEGGGGSRARHGCSKWSGHRIRQIVTDKLKFSLKSIVIVQHNSH